MRTPIERNAAIMMRVSRVFVILRLLPEELFFLIESTAFISSPAGPPVEQIVVYDQQTYNLAWKRFPFPSSLSLITAAGL
jgi:hypothetical protein